MDKPETTPTLARFRTNPNLPSILPSLSPHSPLFPSLSSKNTPRTLFHHQEFPSLRPKQSNSETAQDCDLSTWIDHQHALEFCGLLHESQATLPTSFVRSLRCLRASIVSSCRVCNTTNSTLVVLNLKLDCRRRWARLGLSWLAA